MCSQLSSGKITTDLAAVVTSPSGLGGLHLGMAAVKSKALLEH